MNLHNFDNTTSTFPPPTEQFLTSFLLGGRRHRDPQQLHDLDGSFESLLLGSGNDLGQHRLTVGYWEFPHGEHFGEEVGEVPRKRGPTKKLLGLLE